MNILVYYLFFGLLYLIFNSRKVSVTVGSILWCIIGIANYYVLSFKGAPIVPSDIMSAQTAANVAENYTYSIQPIFVWNVLFLLLYLAVLWRCPSSKKLTWKKRIVMLVVIGLLSSIPDSYTHLKMKATIDAGAELDPEVADIVAHEMKEWALEKGATHYTCLLYTSRCV